MIFTEQTTGRYDLPAPTTRKAWEQRLQEYRSNVASVLGDIEDHKRNPDEHAPGLQGADCARCRELSQLEHNLAYLIDNAEKELANPRLK